MNHEITKSLIRILMFNANCCQAIEIKDIVALMGMPQGVIACYKDSVTRYCDMHGFPNLNAISFTDGDDEYPFTSINNHIAERLACWKYFNENEVRSPQIGGSAK